MYNNIYYLPQQSKSARVDMRHLVSAQDIAFDLYEHVTPVQMDHAERFCMQRKVQYRYQLQLDVRLLQVKYWNLLQQPITFSKL